MIVGKHKYLFTLKNTCVQLQTGEKSEISELNNNQCGNPYHIGEKVKIAKFIDRIASHSLAKTGNCSVINNNVSNFSCPPLAALAEPARNEPCETACRMAEGPKSMISRRGETTCRKIENQSERLIPFKKNAAFTLAEVLITLGIIGVVAALTIPGLINTYKAHRLHSQFLKSYSIVQQVFKQMEADDVSLDPNTYASCEFYKTFIKYLQAPFDCGNGVDGYKTTKTCFLASSNQYKTLDGKSTAKSIWFDDGQIALQDGTLLLFENYIGRKHIWISVDLNGYNNPPNRWGYDLFTFQFVDGELVTMGDKKSEYTDMNKYCSSTSTDSMNGITCAQKAKENSDYFRALIKEFK